MPHFVIMGAGRVGILLAHTLEDSGHSVAVVDQDDHALRHLRSGFSGEKVTGHGFDQDVLRRAGIENAYAFAAVSSGDNTNILATRVARETFGVQRVVARIYDPARAEFYQRLGIPTVAAVRWSTDQVLRRILPEQRIAGDWREASGRLQLGELSLHDSWSGFHLDVIQEATGVRIAFVTRFGEGILPGPSTSYQKGDVLHAMMHIDDVDDIAATLAHPPSAQIRELAQSMRVDDADAREGDQR